MSPEKKKNILVVEDESPLAFALQNKLKVAGFNVDHAENGENAILLASKKDYDLILLDLMMPRINGFEVLQYLKKEKKSKAPIIILSNLGQEEDVQKALKMGASDFYIKTNTPIFKVVDKVLSYLKKTNKKINSSL